MLTFLYVLHFLVCFILIGVVLLQRGKGQDLGASLGGGGANTIFGSRGAGNFLTKITTASAIIFMGTSLSLSYLGYKSSDVRLFDESEPFVPEGAAPKADESGLEEVPSAAGDAGATGAAGTSAGDASGAAPDPAAGDAQPGLVEIPDTSDAAAQATEGATDAGGACGSPATASAPSAAPSAGATASPEAAKAPEGAAAPSDPTGASAPTPAPADAAKQP